MAQPQVDPNVQKVLDALNKARGMEIQALHQYMVQHYTMSDLDLGQLCAYLQLIAIDEMKHAAWFAERIDALSGNPDCKMAGPVVQNQEPKEIYILDMALESNTIKVYDELAEICHKAGDSISAGLFNKIIQQEDVHLSYYKETHRHIEKLGQAFLAKYAATSKHTGPIKSFVELMQKEKF